MSKRINHTYEDYVLDGKSMAVTLALSFTLVFLVVLVIGAARDTTVLVVMALLYFGVGVPLILGWQQLLPWLRRRTREHWKRPDPAVFRSIDRRAHYGIESDVWSDVAQHVATEMLEEQGPLGARYATYTLEAFCDARAKWEHTYEARRVRAEARAAQCSIALLPLHPRWSQAILDGTKTIELRRRPLRPDTTHIAIYETAPTQRIVAIAHVRNQQPLPDEQPPPAMAPLLESLFLARAGGEEALAYIEDAPAPVALWLDEVTPVSMRLAQLGIDRAPQSVQYLSADRATLLLLDIKPTDQSTEAAA